MESRNLDAETIREDREFIEQVLNERGVDMARTELNTILRNYEEIATPSDIQKFKDELGDIYNKLAYVGGKRKSRKNKKRKRRTRRR
jgi:hypothetical protein